SRPTWRATLRCRCRVGSRPTTGCRWGCSSSRRRWPTTGSTASAARSRPPSPTAGDTCSSTRHRSCDVTTENAKTIATLIGTVFAGRTALQRINQARVDADGLELLDALLNVLVVISGVLIVVR